MHLTFGLVRGMASLEGDSLLLLYFTISLHQKSVLIRGVVSLEGDSLLLLYFTISLHQKFGLIIKRVWCLVGMA